MIGDIIALEIMHNHSKRTIGEADDTIFLPKQEIPLEAGTILNQLEKNIDQIEKSLGDHKAVETPSNAKFHVKHCRHKDQNIKRLEHRASRKRLAKFLPKNTLYSLKKPLVNEEGLHAYDKVNKYSFSINLSLESMNSNKSECKEERIKNLYRNMAHLQKYIDYTKMQLQH